LEGRGAVKDRVFTPNPKLAWRELEDTIVIISPEDGQVHELNETAGFLWKQMDGQRTVAQLAFLLAEEYDVAREAAQADVAALLAQLQLKGLLAATAHVGKDEHV
jgi:coenzyme PQQ biosynthesis protein PqqD